MGVETSYILNKNIDVSLTGNNMGFSAISPPKLVTPTTPHNAFGRVAYHVATNEIHVFFREGTAHDSYGSSIKRVKSADAGKTWSVADVIVADDATKDVREPIAFQNHDANVGCLFFSKKDQTTTKLETNIRYIRYGSGFSSTPSAETTIASGLTDWAFVWGRPAMYRSSAMFTAYGKDTGDTYTKVKVIRSTNVWMTSFEVIGTLSLNGKSLSETSIIPLLDGTIMAVCRVDGGDFNSVYFISNDGGFTWVYKGEIAINAHSPLLIRDYNNNILLFYRDGSYSPQRGTWVALSKDEGKNWKVIRQISAYPVGYPDVDFIETESGKGVMFLTYGVENGNNGHIVSRKLYY